jgi:DNA-binding NarL/FixJ family response regulator
VNDSNEETRSSTSGEDHASSGKSRAARVLIIDGHPVVREGLRRIIEQEEDLVVCAEADTARGARIAIQDTNPHVIIAEISLSQGDGIKLVREVRAHYPRLPILMLSMHDEAIYAERMLSVGANGYIPKKATREQILGSLRRVIDGGICVSEVVASNMIRRAFARGRHLSADPVDRLTNRELEVLHLIGKGLSTREIARLLHLSVKTIESHRRRIKGKINLRSGTQLVQFAVNWMVAEKAGALSGDDEKHGRDDTNSGGIE